jgi:hypothetical protein
MKPVLVLLGLLTFSSASGAGGTGDEFKDIPSVMVFTEEVPAESKSWMYIAPTFLVGLFGLIIAALQYKNLLATQKAATQARTIELAMRIYEKETWKEFDTAFRYFTSRAQKSTEKKIYDLGGDNDAILNTTYVFHKLNEAGALYRRELVDKKLFVQIIGRDVVLMYDEARDVLARLREEDPRSYFPNWEYMADNIRPQIEEIDREDTAERDQRRASS